MNKFYGWKVGAGLLDEQAEYLEPMVDIFIDILQRRWDISSLRLERQDMHSLVLAVVEAVGSAAGKISAIDTALLTEVNSDEQLRLLNHHAGLLRIKLVDAAVLALLSIEALDNKLKDSPNDGDHQVVQ